MTDPAAPKEEKKQSAMTMKVVSVDIDTLKPHPKNARRGNLPAIKESLVANGQFKPIVVQKSTNFILIGNHTWKGAKDIGWNKIKAIFLDVDDEAAKKIMLSDNRTSDLSTYDTDALADILKNMEEPSIGTGYSSDDVSAILKAIEEDDVQVMAETVRPTVELLAGAPPSIEEQGDDATYAEDTVPTMNDDGTTFAPSDDAEEEEDEDKPFNDALGELQGSVGLKLDLVKFGKNYYDIPELRSDMLLAELPTPFDTWAGKDATPDDGITHWLWNYGVAASSGLPADRATISFFTYDEKFDGWWDAPDFYTAKIINMGIKSAVVPDFSCYSDWPAATHIWNFYRANWLGRYFQECGIKVIPRFQYNDEKTLDYGLLGIPKGCPLLAISCQNVKTNGPGKPLTDDEKMMGQIITEATKRLEPKTLLIYGGPPAHRLVDGNVIKDDYVESIVKLKNYAWKRRGTVFDKKEGLGKTAKKTLTDTAKEGREPEEEQDFELWGE